MMPAPASGTSPSPLHAAVRVDVRPAGARPWWVAVALHMTCQAMLTARAPA